MGMPVIIDIPGKKAKEEIFRKVFDYLSSIDEKFSTYKKDSEITKFNEGKIDKKKISPEMGEVLKLSKGTKKLTHGYFDIEKGKKIDPSGLVKGWAIHNAAKILIKNKILNFYLEVGGDIEVMGGPWKIGIRNPFKKNEIIKVLSLRNCGVATSGTYERGLHIYNPKRNYEKADEIASITVIGPNVYEADRFATAAFAMGIAGIDFIEKQEGLEGYMIDKEGIATMTRGFKKYARPN